MSRTEVFDALNTKKIAILPLGATEQHGYHLPLGTDAMLAEAMSNLLADRIDALVFPVFSYGYSWVWRDIPGTGSIEQPILQSTLKSLIHSISRSGFEMLLIVNGHEANSSTIKYLIRELNDETDMKVLNIFYPGLSEIYDEIFESETWGGMFHADEFETSMMLYHYPEHVNMDLATKEYPVVPINYGIGPVSLGSISSSGVYGDPTLATRDKGQKATEIILNKTEQIVKYVSAK